ncbi:glycosyltransferase family 2 protein [bacterium]|jgi:glycosyltransferase involved in cell wall biosynthesis|nr:glycosyltransferase family 2 protein [bacterium]MBT4121971.1 glycosyltransferase family 2 protein [bacterium]MBT4334833.1 glycosyltransferase family 2 protein [bacterium]MBT4495529.1 glycosyltransferase family 2 protein [bacterium]MBT4764187.1 glycosyltransferase family 2 protein [bacterium]
MKKLSIIIPVYNEKNTINKLLKLVESVELPDIEKEIIIIDDKSTDGTRDILKMLTDQYKVILKDENGGKGSAITLGFKEATGDILIIQDADLEYDPKEYIDVLSPILENKADVVYGSRFISSKPHRVLYFWHSVGNRVLTTFSNMLTNLTLTDMETCYKAFNRQAIDYLKDRLSAQKFGIEPQITALVSKGKFRIYEVGISYYGRTYEEGKKINWKDGIAAFWHIIKYNLFK